MKKFIISIIFTSIIFVLWYYLLYLYDVNNTVLPRIIDNKYYILFLYISIIAWFWIYREDNSKSKFLVSFIFIINFLYLCSIFLIWNIWLTKTECIIFMWLLIIWFSATFLKNWIGYIIITLSIIWSCLLMFFSIIPLYENWPDTKWFDDQFETKFIVYSNVWINKEKAFLKKDNKEYEILDWINEYSFYIKQWWTEILFKSDNIYKNSYWLLLFKWWEFIEITPQSAIKINEDYEIQVLWWNIKYYPENPKLFKFTWDKNDILSKNNNDVIDTWINNTLDILDETWNILDNILDNDNKIKESSIKVELETDENIIHDIKDIYNKNLKYYIKQQVWSNLQLDVSVLKISQKTLDLLVKINPKYQENIQNLNNYLDILWIDLQDYNYKNNSNLGKTLDDIKNSFWDAVKLVE